MRWHAAAASLLNLTSALADRSWYTRAIRRAFASGASCDPFENDEGGEEGAMSDWETTSCEREEPPRGG